MRSSIVLAVLGGWLVAGVPADASAETGTTEFNPVKEFIAADFPWASGFIPAGGPLQVNIGAVAYQEVLIGLPGDAHHDWDASEIWFVGADGEGVFVNTLGAEITATVAVDIGIFNTQFEVGVWDISEEAVAEAFTPYLLPGNPDRPVIVAELIGPFNLVDEPFSFGGVDGTIVIDYAFDVPGISFQGNRIDVRNTPDSGGAPDASVDIELQHEPFMFVDAEPGQLATAYGTTHGSFSSAVALHIYPTVSVVVGGLPYNIGPFDLVVDYPVLSDEEVVFDELSIMLEVPEAPPEPATTGGADDTSGAADDTTGDGGGASADDATSGPTTMDTGADDGATGGIGTGLPQQGDGDTGCGCTSSGRTGSGWLPALVIVAAVRRRRR